MPLPPQNYQHTISHQIEEKINDYTNKKTVNVKNKLTNS
jgi:hypothetical protein